MQFGQLDPVSWSQQLPVATLGNINFMSAFLGFASIACLHHVLESDRNWMQNTFFIILIFWNMSLCWFSGSIQGILIWLVGALVLLSSKLGVLSWSRLRLCILGIALIPIVFLLILGGLGRGALGKILIQETFLFRIDYWLAGLRMTLKNPLLGVGIDSYGDYYRTYRDVTATYRTGSQRVSNTAHNIFLDISSGSGLITLLIILVFFVSILLIGFNSIRKNRDSHTTLLFALASAYVVFSMISINQLGVSCWGWIFFGVLLGRVSYNNQKSTQKSASLERRDTIKKVNTKEARESRSLPLDSHRKFDLSEKAHKGANLFAMCFLFLLGASIALPPLVKDAQYLHVYKLRDSQKMYEVALSELTPDLLREHALKFFVENQEVELATNLARRAIEINPRNFTAQNVIRLLVSTSVSEKLSAISQLEAIEPNDREFLQQLDAQRRELVSQNR